MMGARDGRGGPGATEVDLAQLKLTQLAISVVLQLRQVPNLKIAQAVMGVFVVLTHLVENSKMKPLH